MLPVGFFDRRKLVEITLDARRKLLGLGLEQLELTLTLLALTAMTRLGAKPAAGKPRPFRADARLLSAPDSPNASGGRGFARGLIFTRDGVLVASVAQEGLVRERHEKSP